MLFPNAFLFCTCLCGHLECTLSFRCNRLLIRPRQPHILAAVHSNMDRLCPLVRTCHYCGFHAHEIFLFLLLGVFLGANGSKYLCPVHYRTQDFCEEVTEMFTRFMGQRPWLNPRSLLTRNAIVKSGNERKKVYSCLFISYVSSVSMPPIAYKPKEVSWLAISRRCGVSIEFDTLLV